MFSAPNQEENNKECVNKQLVAKSIKDCATGNLRNKTKLIFLLVGHQHQCFGQVFKPTFSIVQNSPYNTLVVISDQFLAAKNMTTASGMLLWS